MGVRGPYLPSLIYLKKRPTGRTKGLLVKTLATYYSTPPVRGAAVALSNSYFFESEPLPSGFLSVFVPETFARRVCPAIVLMSAICNFLALVTRSF